MDIRSRFRTSFLTLTSSPPYTLWSTNTSSSSSKPKKTHTFIICSNNTNNSSPQQNGDNNNNSGDKSATDWDKAWSKFKKRGKKSTFFPVNPNKYVSWNPRRSEFPLSEEVDPIKRAERSNLMLWTSPRFTLGVAIVIVTFLLIYTLLAPIM